tara:strand:- start:5 stop:220 length:216 start_codon:yes stop_codon:yes gene_type:complete
MTRSYDIDHAQEEMFLRMEVLLREALSQLMPLYSESHAPNWRLDKLIAEIEQCLNEKAVLERDEEVVGIPV